MKWSIPIWIVVVAGCADLARTHAPDLLSVAVNPKRSSSTAIAAKQPRDHATEKGDPSGPLRYVSAKFSESDSVDKQELSRDWLAYSSLDEPSNAFDGQNVTAAIAPRSEAKIQFLLIDLGEMRRVREVVQLHGPKGAPGRYRIDIAGDHNFPYRLVHVGEGESTASQAHFDHVEECRFVRITLLEPTREAWTIRELTIR
ncbi:hypothetical protein Pan216_55930 [Planctomycetes bacterium Pan216]|uniref:F5/8 type C domain-containing protein n=1 Tax=Kolteria novifilia TaxID=2527975 RepID=A0A518BCJ3_9BACT|nr:hypothetical protein Pan216_55930 [Planctomycetes bacterium Pan216]